MDFLEKTWTQFSPYAAPVLCVGASTAFPFNLIFLFYYTTNFNKVPPQKKKKNCKNNPVIDSSFQGKYYLRTPYFLFH